MGLFVNQNDTRTELQKRIAQDLADKAKKKSADFSDRPDGIDDSAYLNDTKKTTSLSWLWLLISIAVIAAVVWLVLM